MLNEKQLNGQLINAAAQHAKLAAKFTALAQHVKAQVNEAHYPVKGITAILHLEQGFFSTTFAGRTLSFVFTSSFVAEASLSGHVRCYLKKYFPQHEQVLLGGFSFSASGKTSPIALSNPVAADMDTTQGARLIILRFLHDSLAH